MAQGLALVRQVVTVEIALRIARLVSVLVRDEVLLVLTLVRSMGELALKPALKVAAQALA